MCVSIIIHACERPKEGPHADYWTGKDKTAGPEGRIKPPSQTKLPSKHFYCGLKSLACYFQFSLSLLCSLFHPFLTADCFSVSYPLLGLASALHCLSAMSEVKWKAHEPLLPLSFTLMLFNTHLCSFTQSRNTPEQGFLGKDPPWQKHHWCEHLLKRNWRH